MKVLFLALSFLISSTAFANYPHVYLAGEVHGSEEARVFKTKMFDAAFKGNITLALEIDDDLIQQALTPEYRGLIFGMEDKFSKGFGILHAAWWLSEWRARNVRFGVYRSVISSDIMDAVASWMYFQSINPSMQKAWKNAEPRLPTDNEFVTKIRKQIARYTAEPPKPGEAQIPTPLDTLEDLEANALVLKEMLLVYVEMALADRAGPGVYSVPAEMEEMTKLLNFPQFKKGEPTYAANYMYLYTMASRLKQKLIIDWRSLRMSQNLLKHFINYESARGRPMVSITGLSHLPGMQGALSAMTAGYLESSIEAPPKSVTSQFSDFLASIGITL